MPTRREIEQIRRRIGASPAQAGDMWIRTGSGLLAPRSSASGSSPIRAGLVPGLDGSGSYDLTQEQKDAIEKVLKDNQSSDTITANSARRAWDAALKQAAPRVGIFGLGVLAERSIELLLDVMGIGVLQGFGPVGPGVVTGDFGGSWSGVISSISVSSVYAVGSAHYQDVSVTAAYALTGDYSCSYSDVTDQTTYSFSALGPQVDSQGGAVVLSVSGVNTPPALASIAGDYRTSPIFAPGVCDDPQGLSGWTGTGGDNPPNDPGGTRTLVFQVGAGGDCYAVHFISGSHSGDASGYVCEGDTFDFDPMEGLGDLGALGGFPGGPSMEEICEQMREDRLAQYYEEMATANAEGNTEQVDLIQGKINKLEADAAAGVCEPDMGLTDQELNDLTNCLLDPECSGGFDPTFDLPIDTGLPDISGGTPPLPTDPGFPCGPSPGDLGSPIDALDAISGPPGGDLANLASPEIPFDGGIPADGFKPGDPLQAGIGDTPIFDGKIGEVKPPDITGTSPPFADQNFTENFCKTNALIVDVVAELAERLGMDPDGMVVDDSCEERWTGCFPKGSSIFKAMWELADRCGFGVFPVPCPEGVVADNCGEIGTVKPLDIWHGPYHEDQNLFTFDPIFDDMETYYAIEITRPATGTDPGFTVWIPVDSRWAVSPDKVYQETVGLDVSYETAVSMATDKALAARQNESRIECAVPYDPSILARHQFIIQRPTKFFQETYMVTERRHDCSAQGYLTILKGVATSVLADPEPVQLLGRLLKPTSGLTYGTHTIKDEADNKTYELKGASATITGNLDGLVGKRVRVNGTVDGTPKTRIKVTKVDRVSN